MSKAISSYKGVEKTAVIARRVKQDAGRGKNGLGTISALEAQVKIAAQVKAATLAEQVQAREAKEAKANEG